MSARECNNNDQRILLFIDIVTVLIEKPREIKQIQKKTPLRVNE